MKKAFALVLALLLCAGLLAACGSSPGTPQTSAPPAAGSGTDAPADSNAGTGMVSDVPVTFSMMYADNSDYPFNENWLVLSEITRLTNVTLDMQVVPDSDYGTKMQLVLNSGSIPDILTKVHARPSSDYAEYALNGILLPIGDYLDDMPNLKEKTETWIVDDYEGFRLTDGKVYTAPAVMDQRISDRAWYIREDLLAKHDLEMPTTWDEFFTVCETLKAEYPDLMTISNRFGIDNIMDMIAPSFGTTSGWSLPAHGFRYDRDDDDWEFAPSSDEYKTMLQTLNRFMAAGLIDPEFNTLDSDIFVQRWASGNIFAATDWPDTALQAETEGKKNDPAFSIVGTLPIAGPDGIAEYLPVSKAGNGMIFPNSVKDNENFDAFIRFIDWFYSEEGTNLFTWGIEGTTYTVENGTKQFKSEFLTGSTPEGTIDARAEYGVPNNNCLTFVKPFEWYSAYLLGERNTVLQMALNDANAMPAPGPELLIPEDEMENVTMYSTALKDYYVVMQEKFIYGQESFDNWDSYVQQCEEKGAAALREIVDAAWAAQQ